MINNDLTISTLDLNPDIQIAYIGPNISEGPLPALFYFALSAEESLCQDPFNQPVAYLSALPMRIFSLTLPGHGHQLPSAQAMNVWAQEISSGRDIVSEFVTKVQYAIEGLVQEDILLPERLGAVGLSRGGFIAMHAAAKIPQFRWIVGFAPLTKLSAIKEFQEIAHLPLVNQLDLENLVDPISDRHIRFYIGNLDTRVGTRHCYDFIEKASQRALEKKIRSPQIEMIVGPSIGHQGHGTSKEVFHAGAQWIAENLGAVDVV